MPENNPISPVYDGADGRHGPCPCLGLGCAAISGVSGAVRTSGATAASYSRGHWLNGRATSQPLDAVVREICGRCGTDAVETSGLFGVVRGYAVDQVQSGRASLQPLLLGYSADVAERDGLLRFALRDGRADHELSMDELAVAEDLEGYLEVTRLPELEAGDIVRLNYVDVQSDFEVRSAEARYPDEEQRSVAVSELALGLTAAEARGLTYRWLAEARVGRDVARLALPPSRLAVGAGDTIRLADALWRVDRVEQGEAAVIEATRVETGIYAPADIDEELFTVRSFVAPVPTFPVFLDLPLLTGEEVPHAPHVAVTAEPWPGTVGVWSSSTDAGFELNRIVAAPAIIGVTEIAVGRSASGPVGPWRAVARARWGGALSSADALAVLNGANVMAIGDGSSDNWEVFQFAKADLVAPDT